VARRQGFYIYTIASDSGVLYVGVTSSLVVRVAQHKENSPWLGAENTA